MSADGKARVCLTTRVSDHEAAALQAWVSRRQESGVDVTISDVLRRCVQSIVREEPTIQPWVAP